MNVEFVLNRRINYQVVKICPNISFMNAKRYCHKNDDKVDFSVRKQAMESHVINVLWLIINQQNVCLTCCPFSDCPSVAYKPIKKKNSPRLFGNLLVPG